MKKKKKTVKTRGIKEIRQEELKRTGGTCELCRRPGSRFNPLSLYFIDRNPKNTAKNNLAILCPPCEKHFKMCNPEGLNPERGRFDFIINRKLYKKIDLAPSVNTK